MKAGYEMYVKHNFFNHSAIFIKIFIETEEKKIAEVKKSKNQTYLSSVMQNVRLNDKRNWRSNK